MAYHTFVSIDVHIQQVCASEFLDEKWVTSFFTANRNSSAQNDDSQRKSSFFWQTISDICRLSQDAWSGAEARFDPLPIFSPLAISKDLFFIQRIISGYRFVSALDTNFYLRGSDPPRMAPKKVSKCLCMTSDSCPHPLFIGNGENGPVHIPRIIQDCFIVDGILASTLECYYNRTYFIDQRQSEFIPKSNDSQLCHSIDSR